jgi:tetratricopeptide (TPR) repeat protein
MTDQVQILDPEIEELLRDIAQDPDSTLLSVERPAEFRSLSLKRGEVSSRSLDWTSPERKLLDSYREQVAFLLRYQYYVGYKNEERFAALRPVRTETAFRGIAQDSGQIRKEAAKEGACLEAEFSGDSAAALIQNCVGLVRDPAVSRMRLAAASLRLVPTDVGREYMGLEYMQDYQLISAREVFRQIIATSANPARKKWAYHHLGICLARACRYQEAAIAQQKACGLAEPDIEFLVALLRTAVQMGDNTEIAAAALRIEAWGMSPAMAEGFRDTIRSSRNRGVWAPSPESAAAIQATKDRIDTMSEVVLDAFL